MRFNCPFILASGSPRREHLLHQLGMEFEILVSDVDEHFSANKLPSTIAEEISARKATAIFQQNPQALTLAADTIVVLEGDILGKPRNAFEAKEMLQRLSNNKHTVYTGLTLAHASSGRFVSTHETTYVQFADMSLDEIEAYVATGSPMDKAGAYGIQDDRGALFVSRIEGDYYNVVGLPLHRLYQVVKKNFSDLLLS